MEKKLLLVEKRGSYAMITFNRPERHNALSPATLFEIADTMKHLGEEGEIRCVVFRGAGDKAFSSGYDISDIPVDMTPEQAAAFRAKNPLHTGLQAIVDFPYPVIAMINGMAFGAGCELAAACDLRIAADSARLGMPPARLGIVYVPAGVMRLINIVGLANAKEIFFTGRYYPASRAKEMGLLNYVVPADQLESFTQEMAEEISGNAPLSLKGQKTVFNACLKHQRLDPEDRKTIERLVDQAFNSEDRKEGEKAFREKRKPVFRGK